MLTQFKHSHKVSQNFLGLFFASTAKPEIEKKVDEIIEKIIRPVLLKEGSDIEFHGIQDDCAVITLSGNASIPDVDEAVDLKQEIADVIKLQIPEITRVREKMLFED
ncbi:NifU-like domain containing protein [Histomonas meleagridis]|uniref:NifU-like domain containing protein n=1 Tax=Histomonas meleagridis TaxID=135588 RepID=UPI00355946C4|nr:NifU-like domain containing protein [Histomonas meleagridis]KAH0799514.1 NifU-like domain containing protein [Histomonas meleagridis]